MIFPIGVDYRTRRYPVLTFASMGLCVLVFLPGWLGAMADRGRFPEWYYALMLTPASPGILGWVSSIFVHGGLFHLLGNLAYLFLFGSPMEDTLGRRGFAAFFLTSGIAAGLLQILLSADGFQSRIPICGASGAISACMGAYVLLQPKAHVHLGYFFLFFFRPVHGTFSLPGWLVISFWFLMDVLGLVGDLKRDGGGGVAFGAHVGGFLFGMAWLALVRSLCRGQFAGHREDDEVPSATAIAAGVGTSSAQIVEAANVLLWENGTQTGPYTEAEVFRLLEGGSVNGETCQFWKPGMIEWKPLGQWE